MVAAQTSANFIEASAKTADDKQSAMDICSMKADDRGGYHTTTKLLPPKRLNAALLSARDRRRQSYLQRGHLPIWPRDEADTADDKAVAAQTIYSQASAKTADDKAFSAQASASTAMINDAADDKPLP
jgi:hypothetical protein